MLTSAVVGVNGSIGYRVTITTVRNLAAGDEITVESQQNSGVTLTSSVRELSIVRLGNQI